MIWRVIYKTDQKQIYMLADDEYMLVDKQLVKMEDSNKTKQN